MDRQSGDSPDAAPEITPEPPPEAAPVPFPVTDILGTGIHATVFARAVAFAGEAIRQRRRLTVCHVNVHTVIEARDDPALRQAFAAADLRAADGMPLVWLARRRGLAAERLYGPDFLHGILAMAEGWADRPCRHFFYGSTPEVVARLTARISERYPRAVIAGCLSPPFHPLSEAEEEADVATINASGADVLWVGLGAPRQEKWMARHQAALQVPLVAGVGAAFDFLAGNKKQAPLWMQRHGLEWLFRLASEPGRLAGRYLSTVPRFVVLLLRDSLRSSCQREGQGRRR